MDCFRVAVRSGSEAERFNDAFYRFLELHSGDLQEFEERGGMMQTAPLGACEQKVVTLWSEEALGQFVQFWRHREARHLIQRGTWPPPKGGRPLQV